MKLTAEGIEPELAVEKMAEEIAAAAGIGEEAPHGDLVAVSSNGRRLQAPGDAPVAATGSWVVEVAGVAGDGGGGVYGRGGLRRGGSNECEREEGRAGAAYIGARESSNVDSVLRSERKRVSGGVG